MLDLKVSRGATGFCETIPDLGRQQHQQQQQKRFHFI
jgi:hypothetical protein